MLTLQYVFIQIIRTYDKMNNLVKNNQNIV